MGKDLEGKKDLGYIKKAASKLVGAMRPGSSGAYLLGCRTQRIILVKIQIAEKGKPR